MDERSEKKSRTGDKKILVVGSINVDLYQHLEGGKAMFGTNAIDLSGVKGQTLPSKSLLQAPAVAAQLQALGLTCKAGEEEAFVLRMKGPFAQKTGGKGANAAAAAGQTCACEFIGNLGAASDTENKQLLADLWNFGQVDTRRCKVLDGPTGTAYILLFADNDNAIVLIGGANQSWPAEQDLQDGPAGADLRNAIGDCEAVMLQREVPDYVNRVVARFANKLGKVVFMDVGGTDAPLDEELMPFISIVAPNESELTFISGVETKKDGVVMKSLVRQAVATLKAKFAALGNTKVEVLTTLGSHGSMYFEKDWTNDGAENGDGLLDYEHRMGTFELATDDGKPKDTTGAGDCYRGSFLGARYGDGKSIDDAMLWAAAAGSLAVEIEGAMPSMPPRCKIQSRIASNRWSHRDQIAV